MTTKQQALYSLMEERGFSIGLAVTTVQMLSHSPQALDEMIDYIYDHHPSESEIIEKVAEVCS